MPKLLPLFSPRMRGCSYCAVVRRHELRVFPAYAGMFRRIGGNHETNGPFSPRMRGCSGAGQIRVRLLVVFPAYAGMFRCGAITS